MSYYARERQLARIQLGMCPDCGEDTPAPGGRRCVVCRDSQNARHRAVYAINREQILDKRRQRNTESKAEMVKRRIENGNCIQCGVKVTIYRRCLRCRRRDAEAKRRARRSYAQAA